MYKCIEEIQLKLYIEECQMERVIDNSIPQRLVKDNAAARRSAVNPKDPARVLGPHTGR
jgi:hypothetical protein